MSETANTANTASTANEAAAEPAEVQAPGRDASGEPGSWGARLRDAAVERWRPIALAALLLAACYAPFQLVPFRVFQLTMVLVYAVALLGLNLLVGHAGQISLGHGAFFAVGAYAAALMLDRWDVPYLLTLPVAAAVAFVLGLGLGVPAVRLHGLYLALVTLSIAVFLVPLLKRFESVTGGSMGLTLTKPAPPAWTGLAEDQWLYFLALAVAVAAFLLARNLLRSRVGRALHAVRDNEAAAEVMGVRLPFYKTLAFAWSAMFAGAAGCVYTWVIGFVSPDSFPVTLSITLLAGIVVGGLGSLSGPLLGGLFVMFVPSWSQDINKAAPGVIFGLLIIAVMYVAPTGLAGLAGRAAGRIRRTLRRE
ncbi:amino acid/amide ABC transporter membrane protein 2, HAAT family [Thermomonospora echinospora]|uniref:Amino acid/amide ABC transporter membrane protein 2, HAAT family n=1 Tax=Thermomonospora echinospora TaxID=1992 RepID=A0A1H5ZX01_9ACTN|nr:branched-chain amino acid ABC transporter permease [Thermomonospora echinospora]SEG40672.1 amino acid/amide ABC transporter membrane protein 2, HAAT family [Thermomonospora echinospora]